MSDESPIGHLVPRLWSTSDTAAMTCPASGWGMHPSNVDESGQATCPQCEAMVGTVPDKRMGRRVRVIREHVR